MNDYSKLPEHLRDTVERYVEHRIGMGGFMTAVFANDLVEAVGRADNQNIHLLKDIVQWLYNEAPSRAYEHSYWGSYAAVDKWLNLEPRA